MEEEEEPAPPSTPSLKRVKASPKKVASPGTTSSPKKQKPIQMDLLVPHAAPKDWEKVYGIIKEMRKDVVAPVDTMGCASAMLEETDPKVCRERFAFSD